MQATPLIFLLVTLGQIWGGSSSAEKSGESVARKRKRRTKPAQAWLVSDPVPRWRPRMASALVQGGVVALVLVAVIAATLISARPAIGLFRSTVGAQHTLTTGQLAIPTGVQATCVTPGRTSLTVSWDAAGDGLTTGYTVWRTSEGTTVQIGGPNPSTALTVTDSSLPRVSATYVVRSHRANWQSANSAGVTVLTGNNGKC